MHKKLSNGTVKKTRPISRWYNIMFVVVSSYQHPCTLGIVIAVLLLSILYGSQRQSKPYPLPTDMAQKRKNDLLLLPPRYECPEAANLVEKENQHSEWYNAVSQRIMETSVTDFLEKFRDTEFDHWGRSYNQVKGGMFAWKSQRFSELRNGSSIYESACGIGLNLYMTLEILYETHGISNLIVYGNEYVPESVKIARTIFQEQHSPNSTHRPRHGGRLGSICVGDSVQLSYVPANALDLVYTGYISPLFNPLQWTNGTVESNFELYMEHCHHHTVHDMELAKQAQQIQNDWYAKWVGEMIRIAKPGAPVIIEQVSFPLCEATFDWGGVHPDFWKSAVDIYAWDIDPSSIEFEADTIFRKRYHVFMRKRR